MLILWAFAGEVNVWAFQAVTALWKQASLLHSVHCVMINFTYFRDSWHETIKAIKGGMVERM